MRSAKRAAAPRYDPASLLQERRLVDRHQRRFRATPLPSNGSGPVDRHRRPGMEGVRVRSRSETFLDAGGIQNDHRNSPYLVWFEADPAAATSPASAARTPPSARWCVSSRAKGVRVPPGFATTADAYWRFVEANGCASGSPRSRRPDAGKASLAETGHCDPQSFPRGRLAGRDREAIAAAYRELCQRAGSRTRRRGALQRHGRGPAGRELRRAAGDIPQHPRRGGAARRLPPLLRLALHRPRHQLPRGQGLRPHEGGALDRRAADGARRPRRRPA